MKALTEDTMFARCLGWLAKMVMRHPRLVFISHVLLFVAAILVTLKYPGIEFDTRRDNLVGSNQKYHENYLKFRKEFPQQDDLVVMVESENPEKNRQFIERLAVKLETATIMVPQSTDSKKTVATNLFTNVFFKGEPTQLGNKGLLFVPEDELLDLKSTLQSYSRFVQQFVRTTNLVSLFDMVNTQFRTAKRETNAENDSLISALPALERILVQARSSLRRAGTPPSPGVTALFDPDGKAEQRIYITFNDGQIYLLTVHAPNEDLNGEAVKRLRKLVSQTKNEVPGLNVGLTGGPVLELDEMAQSERDTALATVVAFALVFVIIIFGYGKVSRRIKADACLIVGMAYTMAFTTLAIGHLNILTVTFAPIIVGIAIDFGVHLIARYEEELLKNRSAEEALRRAMVFTGQGIFTGAFTTACAFLAMGLTDFKGIQEMGIICGGGLMVCLIPMMMLLPVLLLREKQSKEDLKPLQVTSGRERIEQIWLKRPVWTVVITLVLSGLAFTQFQKIYFDYDLLNMQSKGLPAVLYEEKLIAASPAGSAPRSVLFGVVIADSPEQALQLEQRLKQLPSVATNGVISIADKLTGEHSQQLATIGEIKELLKPLRFGELDTGPVNMAELSAQTLKSFQGYLGLVLENTPETEVELRKSLISLRTAAGRLRTEMNQGSEVELKNKARKLAAFQQALFTDLQNTFQSLQNQDNSAPLRPEDLPKAMRDRFIGTTGKILLQVYPKKDVWQRDNQEEFVKEVESVYPEATGEPSQLYEYTRLLKESYEYAALYSLGVIMILVFIHFRNIGSVILCLIPVLIGSVWLCGIMGLFKIPFNPANIMTLPLVIGIGVTNGIHILNRFAEERTPGILGKSTGKAVLVSGLTTIAGFGSLILAKHRGIESLGLIMSIGVTACMVAALTFLPALLNIFMAKRSKK